MTSSERNVWSSSYFVLSLSLSLSRFFRFFFFTRLRLFALFMFLLKLFPRTVCWNDEYKKKKCVKVKNKPSNCVEMRIICWDWVKSLILLLVLVCLTNTTEGLQNFPMFWSNSQFLPFQQEQQVSFNGLLYSIIISLKIDLIK